MKCSVLSAAVSQLIGAGPERAKFDRAAALLPTLIWRIPRGTHERAY